MTDHMEITAAIEQARTAPDVTDRASGLEEADRIGGVALVQARLQGQGAEECEECGGQAQARFVHSAHGVWAVADPVHIQILPLLSRFDDVLTLSNGHRDSIQGLRAWSLVVSDQFIDRVLRQSAQDVQRLLAMLIQS